MLPTAAAAALVLTATGAHLGQLNATSRATAATIDMGMPAAAGAATGQLGSADAIGRGQQQRAGRDNARRSPATADTDAVPMSPDAKARAAVQAEADAAKTAAAHAWVAPVDGSYTLTSGFEMRWGTLHPGQDFAVPVGTPVKALSAGTVLLAGWQSGYGNKLEIEYWDGTVSWFAHNSKLLVAQGDQVTSGQTVATSGNTGHSTGPHLHLEIHPAGGSPVPPIPWLASKGITLTAAVLP